jgi:phage gp29-like protein
MPSLRPQPLYERVMRHSQTLDTSRRYLTDAPTSEGFARWLKSIDEGDLAAAVEISEEMEAKDAHLQGVMNRRRGAVTALPWDVLPDPDAENQEAAQIAADFVRNQIKALKTTSTSSSWAGTLKHLTTAIGPGLAVTELVWAYGRLVKAIDVPGDRLIANNLTNRGVYVLTDEDQMQGVEATGPKWVVHTPHMRSGFPLRVTPIRATMWLFVMKHAARADWAAFSETFGMPVRIGKHPAGMADDQKTVLANMLRDMGSDLYAIFPEGVDVEFKEVARGNQPYEGMIDWIERKQAILFLGQTLSTEPGTIGSLALGRVHEDVRAALTLDDLAAEADMVQQQVFKPICRFRWPGIAVPVPIFRRQVTEDRNLDAERLDLDKFRFLQERNLPVDNEVIYDRLGIPPPKQAAEAIEQL